MLSFTVDTTWSEARWSQICGLFEEAFPDNQRKEATGIQNLLAHGNYAMHTGWLGDAAVAIAFTERLPELSLLFIDYMAVASPWRSRGLGAELVTHLALWAPPLGGIVAEVDVPAPAEPENGENRRRLAFYQANGFTCLPTILTLSDNQRYYLILRRLHPTYAPPDATEISHKIRHVHHKAGISPA